MKMKKNTMMLYDSWIDLTKKTFEYFSIEFGYDYTRTNGQEYFGQEPWYYAIWFV